jgi:hypothetical protein
MFGTQRYVSNALYECCKFEQTAWMDDRVKKFVFVLVQVGSPCSQFNATCVCSVLCNLGQRRKSRAFLSCSSDLLNVFLYVQVTS